ncbi:glycosyltransferase family 39 protein [Paraburkholderia sp. GAS334]|uniref:glycosyltransferase family 39 protein n=1 Tax=Paraburkholderia sp. GAS334 TaxID=3035131 RepID=UPI003D1BB1B9
MAELFASHDRTSDRSNGTLAQSSSVRFLSLLLVHAVVWTFAAWLSRGNLDFQGDMVENYAWGIEWQAGYVKHPPLFAWITAAWFSIAPHTDLAYFALSAINALIGLLGIVALGRRFMPWRLAIVAGLAMAVSPLYTNLAIKFNANAVLLSVWPWTAYFFVRFMQSGGRRWAFALGVFAGLAILGKYFSVVLLVALLGAALARPAWRARTLSLRSLWVAAGGVVALFAHVRWLVLNHFPTFGYASERTGGMLWDAVGRFGIYTLAQIGYLVLSFGFVLLLVPAERRRAAKLMMQGVVKPSLHPELWCLAMGPWIVVGVMAVLAKTQMSSVWGMAQWFAIVPLWLAILDHAGIKLAPARAVRMLCVYWTLVLVASATVGYLDAKKHGDSAVDPRAELASAAHAAWRERTGQDLPIVGGSVHEAQSIAFYSDGHTRFWNIDEPRSTPWLVKDDLTSLGALLVCEQNDTACLRESHALSGTQPVPLSVRKHAWGMSLPERTYEMFLVMPHTR